MNSQDSNNIDILKSFLSEIRDEVRNNRNKFLNGEKRVSFKTKIKEIEKCLLNSVIFDDDITPIEVDFNIFLFYIFKRSMNELNTILQLERNTDSGKWLSSTIVSEINSVLLSVKKFRKLILKIKEDKTIILILVS